MKILIDTTPLVALCDDRDTQHPVALKQLEKLASAELCTCEAVLMESCFHLQRIAVLCGRDKRLRVWTYDREFRTTWRRPDGTVIPLAIRA